jgi:hypothetical protein
MLMGGLMRGLMVYCRSMGGWWKRVRERITEKGDYD